MDSKRSGRGHKPRPATGDDGRWILRDFNALTDSVPLTSVDCTLALAEVYDKVELLAS